MFSHEKLRVYGKALDFASRAAVWLTTWDKRHAVTDQLDRASQSILLNLAEAADRRGSSNRLQILDYATGSTLECAACLDVAKIKSLLTAAECDDCWQGEAASGYCLIERVLTSVAIKPKTKSETKSETK